MTNSKEKGKLRLSFKRGGISGRTNTIITGREGIVQINQDLTVLRLSV